MFSLSFKQETRSLDTLIIGAGDSIGPGLFLLGNFLLLSADGLKSNPWQQLALTGWIVLNISSAFLLPLMRYHFHQSWILQKIGNQDSLHVFTALGYVFFTLAYVYGSYQMESYGAMGYGIANTLGNVFVLLNKLVLTPARLSPSMDCRKILRIKDCANWLGVFLRGFSYLSLGIIDAPHAVVATLFALALYAIHRRAHLVALTPSLSCE